MPESHFYRIKRGGNQAAIVFVHGLFGHYRQTWGEFPFLVTQDTSLNHCDIICWGYPSKLRVRHLCSLMPFVGDRMPTVTDVANALNSDLNNPEIGCDYTDLVLVGHSLGGLVIKKMIIAALQNPTQTNPDLLNRIRRVVLYATPSEGVQLPILCKAHPQAKDLACDENFVNQLQTKWSDCVDEVPPNGTPTGGKRYIPVTVVVGLEDNAVTRDSAKSFHHDVETASGNHTEVCKPPDRDHTSFQVLKDRVLKSTVPRLICGAGAVMTANIQIVQRAADRLFVAGSRSRDEKYLGAIEEQLKKHPDLIHYRVLIGPPRLAILKDHLLKLLQIRSPDDLSKGYKTIHMGMFANEYLQPEIFLCGNESSVLAVLPPMTGIGEFTTAAFFTDPELVDSYLRLTKDLYNKGRKIETVDSVKELSVKENP